MRRDLHLRLLPFTAAKLGVWLLGGHPDWLGLRGGRLAVQLGSGLGGGILFFGAAAGAQLLLIRMRGATSGFIGPGPWLLRRLGLL